MSWSNHLPIYRFLPTVPCRPHTITDRLEKELRTLEAHGIIIEQTIPQVRREVSDDGQEFLAITGGGTMANGLAFTYAHDLSIIRTPSGDPFVIDEDRSYTCSVYSDDVLVRYDSGHPDHKQWPHLASPWADARKAMPPAVPLDREVGVYAFLMAVDDWRSANEWRLPAGTPPLSAVRLPVS